MRWLHREGRVGTVGKLWLLLETLTRAAYRAMRWPARRSYYIGQESFRRVIQWDGYSCAPCSVVAILRHFGRCGSMQSVTAALQTDVEGTEKARIAEYLRRRRFVVQTKNSMTLRELGGVLARGGVVIAFLDGDHVAVVYGMDRDSVFVADSSLLRGPVAGIPRRVFRRRWEDAGLVVWPP